MLLGGAQCTYSGKVEMFNSEVGGGGYRQVGPLRRERNPPGLSFQMPTLFPI